MEGCRGNMEWKAERLRQSGRLGEGVELKAWGVVGWSGRLGEGRTEGFGCGRVEWKARRRQN